VPYAEDPLLHNKNKHIKEKKEWSESMELVSQGQMIRRFMDWKRHMQLNLRMEPWKYMGLINDGKVEEKKLKKKKPFMRLYKIMPE
jgi:hypothetical protein